jgi:hypothetical protein
MRRRNLLKLGVGGAVVLAVAGTGMSFVSPGLIAGRLTTQGAGVFRAVARAVLDGSLPARGTIAYLGGLNEHLKRLNEVISALPVATQVELSRLLALLSFPLGRVTLTGLQIDWDEADVDEIQQALQNMRLSAFSLKQQAYHALRDLTNASFYSNVAVWHMLGYPGPQGI